MGDTSERAPGGGADEEAGGEPHATVNSKTPAMVRIESIVAGYTAEMYRHGLERHAEILRRVADSCHDGGLDICCAFNVANVNQELPDVGVQDALGIVIGNSRALWSHVRRSEYPHPVDEHTERVVHSACADTGAPTRVVFAHGDPARPFPIQQLAVEVGLAEATPCGLVMHQDFGLWWALRAVIVVGVPGPAAKRREGPRVCAACADKPCIDAFVAAGDSTDWKLWLTVRDACPVARDQRYSDEQAEYHYRTAFERLR